MPYAGADDMHESAPNGGSARYPDVVLPPRFVSVLSGSALALGGRDSSTRVAAALYGEAERTLFSDWLPAVVVAGR